MSLAIARRWAIVGYNAVGRCGGALVGKFHVCEIGKTRIRLIKYVYIIVV